MAERDERIAAARERNLARGRQTQARNRKAAAQRARRERIAHLRRRRTELNGRLPAAREAYERALRHPRCDGLDEAGAVLMGIVRTLKAIEIELEDLDA